MIYYLSSISPAIKNNNYYFSWNNFVNICRANYCILPKFTELKIEDSCRLRQNYVNYINHLNTAFFKFLIPKVPSAPQESNWLSSFSNSKLLLILHLSQMQVDIHLNSTPFDLLDGIRVSQSEITKESFTVPTVNTPNLLPCELNKICAMLDDLRK
ncbi:hypothetical protein BpHYR1_049386 [Brachionus plicatilis]|uniref:Uncharacterized protein n=1 Tax=Brachionus plicatilis TaxID=10195 RepID=A0A3M7RDL4_BRAPC|nr:hypothetical protein BpHYR1_049386 [Brachionus plicatilis]